MLTGKKLPKQVKKKKKTINKSNKNTKFIKHGNVKYNSSMILMILCLWNALEWCYLLGLVQLYISLKG